MVSFHPRCTRWLGAGRSKSAIFLSLLHPNPTVSASLPPSLPPLVSPLSLYMYLNLLPPSLLSLSMSIFSLSPPSLPPSLTYGSQIPWYQHPSHPPSLCFSSLSLSQSSSSLPPSPTCMALKSHRISIPPTLPPSLCFSSQSSSSFPPFLSPSLTYGSQIPQYQHPSSSTGSHHVAVNGITADIIHSVRVPLQRDRLLHKGQVPDLHRSIP